MHFEAVSVTLFAVATAVALAARWLKVPYTVALVAAGVALGVVGVIDPPHLTKELLYAVFLPGLVFEAAFHLDFQKFWQNKVTISSLAVPGVAAAIGLTAILLQPLAHALHLVDGFTMRHALVFSALIAATDPIAVVALFKSLGAPKRLTVLVEGESLLNDGTAVVFFTLILGVMIRAKTAALSALEQLVKDGAVHSEAVTQLRDEYAGAIADAEQRIKDLHLQAEALRTEEQHAARRHMLVVEKDTLLVAFRKGYLSQEAHEMLAADVDSRLLNLESH